MIFYLDTSAVVKLFINESGTPYVQSLIRQANRFATSKICKTEFSAALAKSVRMGIINLEIAESARSLFSQTWISVIKVEIDNLILDSASELAWLHGLRGYDAIHLASALYLDSSKQNPVNMITYDRQLWDVSNKIGLLTLPENY